MLFERLRRALGEQNWFSVVLETTIVVLGVVIGFQVTAWGNARADASREAAYSRQILVDLSNTQNNLESAIEINRAVLGTVDSLLAAFDAFPASPDSVLQRLFNRIGWESASPATGTVRAIVVTGDLNLVKDDSRRAALIRLADLNERFIQDQNEIFIALSLPAYREVFRMVRPMARSGHPHAVRHTDLLRDPAYYDAVQELSLASGNIVRVQMTYQGQLAEVRAVLERGRGG